MMKSTIVYFIFFILIAGSFFNATAQENFATNVTKQLNLDGTRLVVTYDLNYPDTAQLFDVELKIHFGSRIIEPKEEELTGSWGYKITPGNDKTILWDLPGESAKDINLITAEVIASKSTYAAADFDFKMSTPFEVVFNNKSTNSDKFSWEFGDPKSLQGNMSSLKSPVHEYRSAGDYEVGLVATNSKNNTADTVIKVISLVKNDEIRKHKTLRSVWLSASIASAGIGVYGLIKHNSLYNQWKEEGTSELEKKYKAYRIVGPAGLAVSGICISQVISQSRKLKEAGKKISLNVFPIDNGLIAGVAINF